MISLELWKKPKGVTIIEGFPGFGLVGPITTEFLISHLKTEKIGRFVYDELPTITAIHEGEIVDPMAVHYSKEHNIIIFHTIINVKGYEWVFAQRIKEAAEQLKAKEIISLEGVNAQGDIKSSVFYYGNEKLGKAGAEKMKESIIMGVSAALILRSNIASCLFARAHMALPDSSAAANIIKVLDKYLGLGVDPEPLLKQAASFEAKIKNILAEAQKTEVESEKKNLTYLG